MVQGWEVVVVVAVVALGDGGGDKNRKKAGRNSPGKRPLTGI